MMMASSSTKAGSNGGQPVLRHADQRRARSIDARRLRGASVMPDGVADHDEARILIAGIVQRIEAAGDERIVAACRSASSARR